MEINWYKREIARKNDEIDQLVEGMQRECDHRSIKYASGGDAGDGDLWFSAQCKICGKYASYTQGYWGTSHNGEKEYEDYKELCQCEVK